MLQSADTYLEIVRDNELISKYCGNDPLVSLISALKRHLAIYTEEDWDNYSKMRPQLRAVLRLHLKNAGFPEDQISEAVKQCINEFEKQTRPSVQSQEKEGEAGKPESVSYNQNGIGTQTWLLHFIDHAEQVAAEEDYHGKIIMPGKNDVDVLEMARFFATRATRKEPAICSRIGVDYDYDVVHTTKWFAGQVSTKVIVYEHKTQNRSARRTYNCFRNPISLLWIAVVLGEESDTLRRAAREMNANWTNLSSASAAVRRVIPFDRIMTLWRHRPE